MTPHTVSKISQDNLLDGHRPPQPVDDGDTSSGNGSLSGDLEDGSSLNESESNSRAGTSSRTGNTDEDANMIKDGLARKETRNVFRLRIIVIQILVATGMAMCFTVYHITHQAEIDKYESEIDGVSHAIIASMDDIVNRLSVVAGLAVAISAEGQQEWPYVRLDAFQKRASNARFLSGVTFLSINPIVNASGLAAWESYVQESSANSWIAQDLTMQEEEGLNEFGVSRPPFFSDVEPIHRFNGTGGSLPSNSTGPLFLPRWQMSPILKTNMVNENLLENPNLAVIAKTCIESKSAVLGAFQFAPPGGASSSNPNTAFFATLASMAAGEHLEYLGDPMSHLAIPIFEYLNDTDKGNVVGVLQATLHWRTYLRDILPPTDQGYQIVIENNCGGPGGNMITYQIDGPDAKVVSLGDKHDRRYSQYLVEGSFSKENIQDGTPDGLPFFHDSCPYVFRVYPTQDVYDKYISGLPIVGSLCTLAIFIFTIAMFLFYDNLVERRQKVVLAKATQSTAIISSLFPRQVRDRLLALETEKNNKRKSDAMFTNNYKLKSFLNGGSDIGNHSDQPIADLFPHCTVMFADISGFTAWSSAREPAQVFILLQTVYQSFDVIAKQRRVFKVETIGDSYVAVTGLPEPQTKHASIMARFAWDCLIRIGEITKELESTLGPDTAALSMRFGLHSGAVTAGVLKGDRARFQLFGDTVNTAARMESTGMKGRIQVSSVTAEALKKENKGAWLTPRNDNISAKGKGVLSTYWLVLKNTRLSIETSPDEYSAGVNGHTRAPRRRSMDVRVSHQKDARLVDWVSEILLRQIKKVVVVHQRCPLPAQANRDVMFQSVEGKICLDEVQEAICTPEFNADVAEASLDHDLIEVPEAIAKDLREYVEMIAASYRSNNKFHNFEHACHVTLSVAKLLGRVVTPDLSSKQGESAADRKVRNEMAAQIHNFTHGLTSDPLATLALVFAGLIHDVDHQGVSNCQLAKEEPELAEHYRNKSVAEQNSLDVAWDRLMADRFLKLREYIFETQDELLRFRQLIVNMVLATDIFDKELNQLRKDRWERAFHANLPDSVTKDLRATIVMEHIMQASDVSHTMQHWHIYQKWNRRLFEEMYAAFKAGRMGSDPRTFWYHGELGFFDNYIIPLASKLKECNVFGVSSDEYLAYALKNRAEWEDRGQEMIQTMLLELDSSDLDEKTESSGTGGIEVSERESSSTFFADEGGMIL